MKRANVQMTKQIEEHTQIINENEAVDRRSTSS